MRTYFILLLISGLLAMTWSYEDMDDHFDFDAMATKKTDTLKQMLDCFFDRQPCDNKFKVYKSHIRESLQDACAECSLLQKHNYRKFISGMKRFFPQDYEAYVKTFDSNPKPHEFEDLEKEVAKY